MKALKLSETTQQPIQHHQKADTQLTTKQTSLHLRSNPPSLSSRLRKALAPKEEDLKSLEVDLDQKRLQCVEETDAQLPGMELRVGQVEEVPWYATAWNYMEPLGI